MKNRHTPRIYRWALRYPLWTLGLCILVSFLSFLSARQLKIENNLLSLLPSQSETVQNLKELQNSFGGRGSLVVGVESPDPQVADQFAELFAQRIEGHPDVHFVEFRHPVDFFKKRQWLYLDVDDLLEMERRVARSVELEKKGVSAAFHHLMDFADPDDSPDLSFQDILGKYKKRMGLETSQEVSSNEEGTFLIIRVKAKEHAENLDASRKLIGEIQALEYELKSDPRFRAVDIGYAGDYQKNIEDADATAREVANVSWVVTLLLFLILFLYFRRLATVFLIGVPLAAGILWTGGFLYLAFGHLSIITAFGAAILAGLGSDYGIYLLSRYYDERQKGENFERACDLAFSATGKATYVSMFTTVGGFIALLFSDFGIFVEFGALGAFGLFANYVAMMLFMPSLLSLMERWRGKIPAFLTRELHLPGGRIFSTAFLKLEGFFVPKRPVMAILGMVVLCTVCVLTIPQKSKIYFEDGQLSAQKKSDRIQQKVDEVSRSPFSSTVIMVKGMEDEERTVRNFEKLLKAETGEKAVFDRVVGVSSFIPSETNKKKEILGKILSQFQKLEKGVKSRKEPVLTSLKDSLAAAPATLETLPNEVRRYFESFREKGLFAVYVFPKGLSASSEHVQRYHDKVQDLKKEWNIEMRPADSNFITLDTVRIIGREAPRGLLLIMLFLFIVLLMVVRPVYRAISIWLHLLASLILLSGLLWLLGMRLNVMNIAVFPIILGTAIDCFIHFGFRFDETGNIRETVMQDLPAVFVSNLTSIAGFGGLILTTSSGLRSVGWVAVLGLSLVTLICAFVYPRYLALEGVIREWFLRRQKKPFEVLEPSSGEMS